VRWWIDNCDGRADRLGRRRRRHGRDHHRGEAPRPVARRSRSSPRRHDRRVRCQRPGRRACSPRKQRWPQWTSLACRSLDRGVVAARVDGCVVGRPGLCGAHSISYTRAHPNWWTDRMMGRRSLSRLALGWQSASRNRAPLPRTNLRALRGVSDPSNSLRTASRRAVQCGLGPQAVSHERVAAGFAWHERSEIAAADYTAGPWVVGQVIERAGLVRRDEVRRA
jgi:hypothetical protein